jgi:hypothetical protein
MAEIGRRPRRIGVARERRATYTLVLRGDDGRLRCERFDSRAAYRARLAELCPSAERSLSFDDLAALLDR